VPDGKRVPRMTTGTNPCRIEGVRARAEKLLADYLRPLVEVDGGTIELLEVTAERVVVRLQGTCKGCPGQPFTLARVIEPAFKRAFGPDVVVEARIR